MHNEFNENSTDAMFARILAELQSVHITMREVRDEAKKTNGRVNKLEIWRTEVTAKTAVIASVISVVVGAGVSIGVTLLTK